MFLLQMFNLFQAFGQSGNSARDGERKSKGKGGVCREKGEGTAFFRYSLFIYLFQFFLDNYVQRGRLIKVGEKKV